jgi:hypothetical protein
VKVKVRSERDRGEEAAKTPPREEQDRLKGLSIYSDRKMGRKRWHLAAPSNMIGHGREGMRKRSSAFI